MTGNARIVVVDDEPDLRDMVRDYLGGKGFAVRTADSGAALSALLEAEPADLLLLDVTMPGEDGLAIARRLSSAPGAVGAAIIFVTAADEVADKVVGLELGADDYITKPFDLRELLARVRAVLRRRPGGTGPFPEAVASVPPPAVQQAVNGHRVRFGIAELDLQARRLVHDDGTDITITAMEYDLLQAFASHPNRVLSRDQLLDMAHNRNWEPFDRSIDVRIARIRRKIEPDPAKPTVIKTVRGAGYIFLRDPAVLDPGL